jgi:predicted PurR-regulated permease PerM
VVYVLLVGILIAGGVLVGGKVSEEASALVGNYPKIIDHLKQQLAEPEPAWLHPIKQYIYNQVSERGESVGSVALPIAKQISQHAVGVLSSAVFVILIPILSFFFLKDGRDLTRHVLSFADKRHGFWESIVADLHLLLGQFIRALVTLSGATFLVYAVFFAIIGLPYSALLASLAALLEFIPVIGPATGALIIILVSVFSGAGHLLVIVIFLAVYRLFQDYVLNPHLMSSGVELHPLLVIFGVLAGEELAGIPGMFRSVPVIATLRVFYLRIQKARVAPQSTLTGGSVAVSREPFTE